MAKSLLVVHLLLLLVNCFTVYGENQDNVNFVALPPNHHTVTPAPAPSPLHHHHHHHQSHPPPIASPALAPSHHDHHIHPPAHAPVHTPTHAPVYPPHVTPSQPPSYRFPRSFVEVQGVVYCKSCKYPGVDTLLGATPVLNATVKLQCNNTKYPITVEKQTDKNGYFLVRAPKTVTNYGAHKCKVFLVSSSSASCQKPSNLHGGATGAILRPEKIKPGKPPVALFTVGPLAFEPKCPHR